MPEKARVIRRRISSVTNTAKITRTMEMVATSKLKRAQARVVSSGPYLDTLKEIMGRLAGAAADVSRYPLLAAREVKKVLLWIVTADRGLCGSYNVNLLRLGREIIDREKAAGHEVSVWMSGRKGVVAFRFREIPMVRTLIGMTDRPTFADARKMAKELTDPFLAGEVDRVLIVWPRFLTLGRQPPSEMQLVPIAPPEEAGEKKHDEVPFLYEPSPEEIFKELLPLYVENMVFRVLAESVVGEMIARRTAMKLATDNAEKLVKALTLQYNKARQSQITMELADILGGSEALK
ncbi:MAG: ATP synthase F1 subunit gamma [Planctomycetes bacterium]|jgi:F-type H+-transporting ATPase subunit gamma|nr:ATP synthase F1 subunit gamma [Planctomycetota bacterium]